MSWRTVAVCSAGAESTDSFHVLDHESWEVPAVHALVAKGMFLEDRNRSKVKNHKKKYENRGPFPVGLGAEICREIT